MTFNMGRLEFVETLSLHQQFRLVEIAHETTDFEIKTAALRVLGKYLNPLVRFVGDDTMTKTTDTIAKSTIKSREELRQFVDNYPGGRAQFCCDAAITEGRLSQILGGEQPSPRLAMVIHRISRGNVPGSRLRPDLWRRPEDVPNIIGESPAPLDDAPTKPEA